MHCGETDRERPAGVLACRAGASAAEFALVLPLLLILLFGTLQVGMLMYSYNTMLGAARDASRAMAVCTITVESEATDQVLKSLPPWVPAGDWDIKTVIGNPDVSTTIKVDPAKAAIISYLPFELDVLQAQVVMRKEPLAFGGGACT